MEGGAQPQRLPRSRAARRVCDGKVVEKSSKNPRMYVKQCHQPPIWEWFIVFIDISSVFFYVGKTILNHPPVITIDRWYGYHSQSWLVYCFTISMEVLMGNSLERPWEHWSL